MAHRSPPNQEPRDDDDVVHVESVPDGALAQTDAELSIAEGDETEGERSRRLAADRRLIGILARENFEGERFDELYGKLALKLTGYAWPILMKWLSTGHGLPVVSSVKTTDYLVTALRGRSLGKGLT